MTHWNWPKWALVAAGMTAAPGLGVAAPSEAEKKAEAAIRETLNGSAKAIDACTTKYLVEQPGQDGQARIDVQVSADGWAKDPKVQTELPQARTLRLCLEAVAKGWRFPKPRAPTPLGITIVVAKDVRFKVPKPGDKPPARGKEDKKPKGFLRLVPGSFLPYGQPSSSS